MITDLGVLEPESGELVLVAVHPGVSAEEAHRATGWDLRVAGDLAVTPEPTGAELEVLRELVARG